MSLEKLSADCLTLISQYIDLIEIQELAITSKALRSICLAAQFKEPTTMPLSKIKFPEILLKLTTTIQVSKTIERTGTEWLSQVLHHFNKIKTVDVITKDLSRQYIRAILNTYEASEAVPILSEAKNNTIDTILRRYFVDKQKLYDIQAMYSEERSEEIQLCFDILTYADTTRKIRESDNSKEEDIFINSHVDSMFFKPLFNCIDDNLKLHGNGHSLTESKHCKLKQAKKHGESSRNCRGRVPDRSLELFVTKKLSYHVFIWEVKIGSASKNHPDIAKLGSMLKDKLDYALEQGASRDYTVTGLLIEGSDCTLYACLCRLLNYIY